MEQFWSRVDNFLETLLAPIGWLFQWLVDLPWGTWLVWGAIIGFGGYLLATLIQFGIYVASTYGYPKLAVLIIHLLITGGLAYSAFTSEAAAPMLFFLISLRLLFKH
ncbi:MAG: hypothetical protein JNJ57_13415 [Saprospiraceae bacterium]|nr:hypothetical protein [Saprospiraceae bacterium]